MKNIEAIAFDLDRTLYDRFSTLRAIASLMTREHPMWFREGLSAYALGELLAQADYWLIYGGWEAVYHCLSDLAVFRDDPGYAAFRDFILDDGFKRVAVPYPGASELLAGLRKQGYRLGLITNGTGARQRQKLALLGLEASFDAILISGEFGAAKPDVPIFQEMSKQLETPPERLAFVGDSPETDILGANRAGMISIRVKTSPYWGAMPGGKAAYELWDIFELPGLLARLKEGSEAVGAN